MDKIDEYKKYRDSRNQRMLLAFIGMISIVISILFFSLTKPVSEILYLSNRLIIILGAILFIIGIFLLFNVYLKNRPLGFYRGYDEFEDYDLNSIFNFHLKKNFIDKYGSQYRRFDKPEMEEILFQNELEDFKQKYIQQAKHDLEFAHLFEDLNKLELKFKSQIERLISNSSLNLIIGIITTLLAIVILGASIFQDKTFNSTTEFLSHFLPRISTVIFVELFSFFFLKLYKNNLSEIKYFQNEITNLNFKITSLKTSIKMEDKETLSKIIHEFSITERNFILKKDDTTEKIEMNKIESSHISNFSRSLTGIIESLKK